MLRYILGRLVGAVVVLWVIITASFFLMRFAPGGPFDRDRRLPPNVEANKWLVFGMGVEITSKTAGTVTEVGSFTTKERDYPDGTLLATIQPKGGGEPVQVRLEGDHAIVAVGVEKGQEVAVGARIVVVPKPMFSQYIDAIGHYMTLDFGKTFTSDGTRDVSEELLRALPISFQLGLMALFFALAVGITLGLLAGLKQNTWIDYTVMSGAMVGASIPTMISGQLLVAIFALGLGWFPVVGWESTQAEWATWQHRVLPVMALGLAYVPVIARLTRGGMLEVVRSDWIRAARAKGLSERKIVLRHALRPALLPTISWLGPGTAGIVTGSIVIERVFGIPGLSEHFVTPALNRDYPMVIGVVVVYSAILVLLNLLVDIAYMFLDPRVSYE